jgi:hypothetical protein
VRLPRAKPLAAIALAIALSLGGVSAVAEPTDEELAAARKIFAEGRALEKQNDWTGALERFKKVAEVKMTPQVRYHIALCEESLGHLVAAINGFELATGDAKQPGANAPDVLENAPPKAEALRKRVPSVHLEVAGKVIYTRILLDKAPVAAALFGTDIPVDPGDHRLEVETDGKVVQHKNVSLAEKEIQTVEFEVHDKERPIEVPKTAAPVVPLPPPPGPSRTPVWIAGGVGVAGVVAAGVFYVLRIVAIQRISDSCKGDDTHCDPSFTPIVDDARNYTTLAGVSAGVGAAGFITAGVLYFVLQPKKKPAPTQGGVSFAPTPTGLRVSF